MTRILLLAEKRLGVHPVDLRGALADGSIALGVVGLVGLLFATRRGWGRALGWAVGATFVVASFAIYELVSVFDSLHALSHARFLGDPTFLRGSALHLQHPLLLFSMLVALTLGALGARLPGAAWWRGWGVVLGVCVLGHAILPMSHFYDGWRQRHAVHALVSLLPASARLGAAGTVGADLREAFRGDLDGKRWIGPLEGRPNVLLIMIEAASGASLPSVAKKAKVESLGSMPKLDALAKRHILLTQVVSHQRQTNRGEYAILCGDYPKLLTDQSKMTEQVYGEARRCLPAVLRDAGYATAYVQAAPLGFMLKDQFMKKAGFDLLIGDPWFERSYARTDWGVDDRAFFEQALDAVTELHAAEQPFFATLLTVGTHHPFTIPDPRELEGSRGRQERAFRLADDALDDFLDALDERHVLEDTVVVITSDESAGLFQTTSAVRRLFSQSWSFVVVMLPEPLAKRVDTLFAHVDTALSITDLLGIEDESARFVGRSWFRDYASPREIFAGNTYARRVIMWEPPDHSVVCDESFLECTRHSHARSSAFLPRQGKPSPPRHRRLLAEMARLSRSGRADMRASERIVLLTTEEAIVPAAEGKKLLAGGQYLRVPGGTRLRVDFDLEVQGEGAEVRFHQDVFVDGHERFARKKQVVRDGQRWQLSYEIGVPDESGQLVVQLYARTVTGEVATIRFHRTELSMLSAPETSNEVVVIVEEVSDAPR